MNCKHPSWTFPLHSSVSVCTECNLTSAQTQEEGAPAQHFHLTKPGDGPAPLQGLQAAINAAKEYYETERTVKVSSGASLSAAGKVEAVMEMIEKGMLTPDDAKTLLRLPPCRPENLVGALKENSLFNVSKTSYDIWRGEIIPIKRHNECTCYTLLNGHLPECGYGK